jgi:hypothetical protein
MLRSDHVVSSESVTHTSMQKATSPAPSGDDPPGTRVGEPRAHPRAGVVAGTGVPFPGPATTIQLSDACLSHVPTETPRTG